MTVTKCKIDFGTVVGTIGKEIFGSFVEHFGRCVYTGIYQNDHVLADAFGFRGDVKEAVKRLGVSLLRWPGGNFVSGYDWKDGIGPVAERRPRPDLAWMQIEPHLVGTAEFVNYCSLVNSEVMMAVNLGTGTPKDACELLEYCNFQSGTYYSEQRQKHGIREPFAIKKWCLGNEMDGNWQICTHTAEEYGRKALETAKMMKWLDPSIELIACGSSGWLMPSCPEWDRKVLEYTYDYVDYISLHRYYQCDEKTNPARLTDYLCSGNDMDVYIKAIISAADYVKAVKRGKKDVMLSFDEYNVISSQELHPKGELWKVGPPRSESVYDHCDALVFASLLMTLIGHCDRVKLACVAQLVNSLGLMLTEPGKNGRCCLQTIAYPFMLLRHCGGDVLLRSQTIGERMVSKEYGEADCIKIIATYDKELDEIKIFALNLSAKRAELELDLCSVGKDLLLKKRAVYAGELFSCNTFDDAYACHTKEFDEHETWRRGTSLVTVAGYSLNMFVLQSQEEK